MKHLSRRSKLKDPNCEIYSEECFNRILCLERKRSERSQKPFMLMLIDLEKLPSAPSRIDIANKIVSVLLLSTRETDLKGWYRQYRMLGIIFSEIGESDLITARDRIYEKFRRELPIIFKLVELQKIYISFHFFPPLQDSREGQGLPDLILYPDLKGQNRNNIFSRLIKRAIDVIGSVFTLIIFSPFFVVIPILIKLTSDGPVLFRQKRVGQFGKIFTFLKFRSMFSDSDPEIHRKYVKNLILELSWNKQNDSKEDKLKIYKLRSDPRVTPIGRFIRKTSIDELPQFINVLKNDMSIVGPRPAIPYEIEWYDIWHLRRVFEVKPGITGLWQVKGRSLTTFDEMVRLDLQYIRERSLWLDFKILFQTPLVVLNCRGAY